MRNLLAPMLIVLLPSMGAAQEREHAPIVLQLPADARALAMGGAFALGSSDAAALFYNPAFSTGSGVSLGIQRYGGAGTTVSLAAAAEWWGGRVGLGLLSAEYGVSAFDLIGGVEESALARSGPETVAEQVAVASYVRRIRGVRLGAAAKLIDQRAAGDGATMAAFDVSTGLTVSRVNLGLTVQNIGPSSDFVGLDVSPPLRITLGSAFTRSLVVGPFDLLAAAAVSREASGTFVPGGGVELSYWPVQGRTFSARFGLRDPDDPDLPPWTFGAGFSGDRITLDWAYHSIDNADGTHRLTLRFR